MKKKIRAYCHPCGMANDHVETVENLEIVIVCSVCGQRKTVAKYKQA